jgi:hypothetical protein
MTPVLAAKENVNQKCLTLSTTGAVAGYRSHHKTKMHRRKDRGWGVAEEAIS